MLLPETSLWNVTEKKEIEEKKKKVIKNIIWLTKAMKQ